MMNTKNDTSDDIAKDFSSFCNFLEDVTNKFIPFSCTSYSYDVFMGLNDKEKFAFEVIHRQHRCNVFKHLISTLRQQREHEDKEFRLDKDGSNGIGYSCCMTCKTCGKQYDITDYSIW